MWDLSDILTSWNNEEVRMLWFVPQNYVKVEAPLKGIQEVETVSLQYLGVSHLKGD